MFPIAEVNRIAEKESTGFGRRHYRPVYVMHKWWARRLGSIFRAILLYSLADESLPEWDGNPENLWGYYSKDIDLGEKVVLDPMMGGGTTVVEALRFGCKVIAGDLNPVSWFVVRKQIDDVDPEILRTALCELEEELGEELRQFYKTTCPECGKDAEAIYYFHHKEVNCMDCGTKIPLMKNFFLAKSLTGTGDIVVCPQCWDVFEANSSKKETNCKKCGFLFIPNTTTFINKRKYYCPNGCEPSKITMATADRPLKYRQYAVEFYCKSCDIEKNPRLKNGRGYKKSDNNDQEILQTAINEFEKIAQNLPIPNTDIPIGVETRRALNHGYRKFKDMFSPRQLLNLGKIYRWILDIDDWDIKEFFLLAFSNSLKYNNLFAKYNATQGFITDIFRTHSFSPSMAPMEANCYDIPKGRGAFTAFVNLVIEGKEYCRNPFERIIEEGKMKRISTKTPIIGRISSNYEDFKKSANTLLVCGTSERIDVLDRVADAVVTDPPYYGNVMYSELSNFFYVWLRIALKEKYPHFASDLVQNEHEIIENRTQEKGELEFLSSLTKVFSESVRIMKDDGVFVFTFHHKREVVWGTLLKAVLGSGLYVSAVYPVRSEMRASTHLYGTSNIIMDIILVCRKRIEPVENQEWKQIQQLVIQHTQSIVADLERSGNSFSFLDVYMLGFGKYLELYSKHYPYVHDNGNPVGIKESVDSIRKIVSEYVKISQNS